MGRKDFGLVYVSLPGFAMKITFVLRHAFGVYPRWMHALYIVVSVSRNSFGRCSNISGLMPSGPGLFFFSNPSRARRTRAGEIQSVYLSFNASTRQFLRLL